MSTHLVANLNGVVALGKVLELVVARPAIILSAHAQQLAAHHNHSLPALEATAAAGSTTATTTASSSASGAVVTVVTTVAVVAAIALPILAAIEVQDLLAIVRGLDLLGLFNGGSCRSSVGHYDWNFWIAWRFSGGPGASYENKMCESKRAVRLVSARSCFLRLEKLSSAAVHPPSRPARVLRPCEAGLVHHHCRLQYNTN